MEIPYEEVKHLMLQNKWINSQHTQVPGPDGQISFGGACLPKDTRALHAFLAKKSLPCELLAAVIKENNKMRN
jgi:UDP-glucose 6-dehydrogenase